VSSPPTVAPAISEARRVLVDLAGFEHIPLFSRRMQRLPPMGGFGRAQDEPAPTWIVAADTAVRDCAALPTLGRLARERRIEFCSYPEFAAPGALDKSRGSWRELLGDVPVTKIAPAISRAALGEDIFRDLEEPGALLRLCAGLKRGEWTCTHASATDTENTVDAEDYDTRRSVDRFRRMAARVQGHHLANLFHLWSAERAGCSYWLAADETLEALLRERVDPFLSPALTCRLVRPDRLLELLGVDERDAAPGTIDRVVSIATRRSRGADPATPLEKQARRARLPNRADPNADPEPRGSGAP
jgi:hypothetical protein